MNKLKSRVNVFLTELGIPATTFCKKVNISYTSYQHLKRDMQKLSEKAENRISDYLAKYNF